ELERGEWNVAVGSAVERAANSGMFEERQNFSLATKASEQALHFAQPRVQQLERDLPVERAILCKPNLSRTALPYAADELESFGDDSARLKRVAHRTQSELGSLRFLGRGSP